MTEEKLKKLEDRVNSLKEEKIRTEENLKNLREQKDAVTEELNALGVAPKDLSKVINELDTKIRTRLTEVDAQIPEDTK